MRCRQLVLLPVWQSKMGIYEMPWYVEALVFPPLTHLICAAREEQVLPSQQGPEKREVIGEERRDVPKPAGS